MTLRNLLVRVGADVSGLSKGLKSAQKEVAYFGRNVTGSMKEMQGNIAKIGAMIGGGLLLKSGMQDAMRYEALMTTLGESLGASRKDFEKWQATVGQSMGFSRLQSAELANTLSLNFKGIASSQQDLTNKTTKMMEVAAIISNKRGMTMQDVSDRIRSAMNQEADGADELGVNVRLSAIKQSQAYQEMANGQPWDKLSTNMQKTILYQHILEQTSKNLGMTMQDTTAMRMAQFTASLADVRMALGQAFLPILYSVLPILTKFAQALYSVLQVVGAFMRSLFGGGFKYKPPVSSGDVKTTKAQAQALGDMGASANKAGKAVEKAGNKSAKSAKKAQEAWKGTFGFDEVNAITNNKTADTGAGAGAGAGAGGGGGVGGGGGIGGGAPLEMPTPSFKPFLEGLDGLTKKMDKYTKPIKEMFLKAWSAIANFAREKFAQISKWWKENGDQIIQAGKNAWALLKPILMFLIKYIWDSIKGVIDGIITFFEGFLEFFSGVFTGDWKKAWDGLMLMIIGAFQTVWNVLNLTFIGGIRKGLINLFLKMAKSTKGFVDDVAMLFKNVIPKIVNSLKGISKNFSAIIKSMRDWWINLCFNLALKWVEFATKVKRAGKTAWDGIKSVFIGAGDWFARYVFTPIVNKLRGIKDAFSRGIGEGFKSVLNLAIDGFNRSLAGFNALKNKTPFAKKIPDLKIPHLARGGITNGATLAMVGDNVGGREVISPLDRLQSMMTNSVIQAMQLGGVGQARQSGDIILNIDGRTFARIVKPFLDREQGRVGSDVRIRTT